MKTNHTIDDLRICVKGCGYWEGLSHECHPHMPVPSNDFERWMDKERLRASLRGKGIPYYLNDTPHGSTERRLYDTLWYHKHKNEKDTTE